jgi:tRNA U34 2-thiouridine synthase MnmA/TrmU
MPAVRALGLLSGGLDSTLAARLLIDQGIEVVGLHLESPTACRVDVRGVAAELGIPLEVRAKGEEYLRLLRRPRWGYGRNMNPCIDCRVFMFHAAQRVRDDVGASFVFTGEVPGQRPMSQHKQAMALIDREAGLEGWVLRPLSARLLPETEPERRGWVDRTRLLDLFGRSRETQLALAAHYRLTRHGSPGGGCLLTDAHFSRRLRDLFDHTAEDRTHVDDVRLLRLGRHFRLEDGIKIILGRDEVENAQLATFANGERWCVEPEGVQGPTALVCGPRNERTAEAARSLIARYT